MAADEGEVCGAPEAFSYEGFDVFRDVFTTRDLILDRLLANASGHADRGFLEVADWWVDQTALDVLPDRVVGERLRSLEDHAIGDDLGVAQDGAETKPWEDERVVTLSDRVGDTAHANGVEGATRRHDGLAVEVARGENGGRELRHDGVTRRLDDAGHIAGNRMRETTERSSSYG